MEFQKDRGHAKSWGFLKAENITPDVIEKVSRLNQLAESRGQKLSQMALSWVLRHNEVTSALIGASNTTQIEEAVESLSRSNFTDEELNQIELVLKNKILIMVATNSINLLNLKL